MAHVIESISAALEGIVPVYRDRPPDRTALPYVVASPDFFADTALAGDAESLAHRVTDTLALWQPAGDEDNTVFEQVLDALEGLRHEGRAIRIVQWQRIPEFETDGSRTIQHLITLRRSRAR